MANSGVPIGSALPQPRVQARLIEAAAPTASRNPSGSIIVPQARDRALEFFEREWVPDQTRSSMGSGLYGDLDSLHKLMRAMVDTWPRLQAKMDEVKRLVRNSPWKAYPWARRGEEPSAQSESLASEFEDAMWQMRPVPHRRLLGYEGMIEALVEGYYFGHQVIEPIWERDDSGWRPASARVVSPRHYGYPGIMDGEDQLVLDRSGMSNFFANETFDAPGNAHRFIVVIRSSHTGHPATGAPLRALVPYWLAVTYGLKWAMLFSQLFGVPFRWATYADDADKAAVETMMANIGTAGWAAFKEGTEMQVLNSGNGSSALPQWKLIELANQECDIFMLGQTLTSSVGDSGSRALGDVHADVRKDVIAGVCDFVGEAITHQLIPAWAWFNYGSSRADLPGWWAKEDKPKDEKALAERDEILRRAFPELKWSEAQIRERHGLDEPIDEDDVLKPEPTDDGMMADIGPDWLDEDESELDDEEDDNLEDEVSASYALIEARKGGAKMPSALKSKKSKRKSLKRGGSATPTGSGMGYDPNQKRIPKGQPNAGRWTDDGVVSKGQRARRGEMRDATAEDRKRLKIPAGFKNAKVTDDPKADLLWTATNAKNQTVAGYSAAYTQKQEAAKFGRIAALHKEMPSLQKQITADANAGNHQALTMRLITATGMRNGGEGGGGKVPTFGASNMRTSQARVEGDKIYFDFIGKKGVRQRPMITDAVLAKHILQRKAEGKETIFDGNAAKTLAYLKKISGDKFKVHDFRTWNATILADKTIAKIQSRSELPTNEAQFKDFQTRVARVVSRKLGNDPPMALKAYIHPAVFNGY